MTILFHILLTILSFAAVWYCAGLLLRIVEHVSALAGRSSFIVSFFLLGLLTSFSEISVSINATLADVPQVAVGNLLGATMVLFLLLAPMLAVVGNGVNLDHDFSERNLFLVLLMCASPAFFITDGNVSAWEGAFLLIMYGALTYRLGFTATLDRKADESAALSTVIRAGSKDVLLAILGAVVIFISGGRLVQEAVYFGELFRISPALIGLIVLGIGTNIPELSVGVRAIIAKKKSAALGDYVGSAAMNAPILGMLALINGGVRVPQNIFFGSAVGLAVGLPLFYIFARTKRSLSRFEGVILLGIYVLFVAWELFRAA